MVFKTFSQLKKSIKPKQGEAPASAASQSNYARRIEAALARYQKVRLQEHTYFQTPTAFQTAARALQAWQTRRLMVCHESLLEDQRYGRAAYFLLHEVYGGGRLESIAHEIQRTADKAGRLLPKGVLATAALALELNALTVEIDEKILQALAHKGWHPSDPIQSSHYVASVREPLLIEKRMQQLDLCQQLAEAIDQYLHSKTVHLGLKMSGGIAESAGVKNLHEFLLEGFEYLKEMGKVAAIIKQIGGLEMQYFESIALGNNPFEMMDHAKEVAPQTSKADHFA